METSFLPLPLLGNNEAKHQNLTLVPMHRAVAYLLLAVILIKFIFLVTPIRSGLSSVVNYYSIKQMRGRTTVPFRLISREEICLSSFNVYRTNRLRVYFLSHVHTVSSQMTF